MENTVAGFGSLVKILCAGVDPRPAETVVVVSGPITAPDDKRCVMAKYMLLIHGDEREWESMTPEQWKAHGTRTPRSAPPPARGSSAASSSHSRRRRPPSGPIRPVG